MDYEFLKNLSWVQKQLFASKCLQCYCEYYFIKDNTINELLEHLDSMNEYENKYKNLAAWERNGAKLELNGRGDPLPQKLLEKIPNGKINEFNEILEYAVETGLGDMYAANSNKPHEYLMKCIKILENNKLKIPENHTKIY